MSKIEIGNMETAEQILSSAGAAGFSVPAAQLPRWAREGLLSSPRQVPLGRGKGTRAVYPTGTTKQFLALCHIHREFRSLPDVGWYLWLDGFAVSEKFWKPVMEDAAQSWDQSISSIQRLFYPQGAEQSEMSDEAVAQITSLGTAPVDNSGFAQLRKLVRARTHYTWKGPSEANDLDDFEIWMTTLIEVATGRFRKPAKGRSVKEEARFEDTMSRGIGIHRARANQLPSVGPMISESLRPIFEAMSGLFDGSMVAIFEDITEEQLNISREQFRSFWKICTSMGAALEDVFGKHSFGFGNFHRLVVKDVRLQARVILAWHVIRERSDLLKNATAIMMLEPNAIKAASDYAALKQLRQDKSEFKPLLTSKRIRSSLRNPDQMESLHIDLRRAKATGS